jgi:hypothetical protein
VLGEYLGRTLTEAKGRPAYVLREHNWPPPQPKSPALPER